MQHIHGGNLRAAQDKFGLAKSQILDFSANINPLGPPPQVLAAIREQMHIIKDYPDPEGLELKNLLAQQLNLGIDQIALGNGAVELVYLLMKAVKPQRVLIPMPTFSEYELAAHSVSATVVPFNLRVEEDFKLDVEQLISQLNDVDMVVVCNPNNPTGYLIPHADLVKLVQATAQRKIQLLIDEAFVDFVPDPAGNTVLGLIDAYPNLAVLYSLTKFYAIPGLRLGMLAADPPMVEQINGIKDPWNVNCFAQVGGVAALQAEDYQQRSRILIKQEREFLFANLQGVTGLRPYAPSANYIFVEITDKNWDSAKLTEAMGKQGILIRDCSSYRNLSSQYIRVAVKDRTANERLLTTLKKTLQS